MWLKGCIIRISREQGGGGACYCYRKGGGGVSYWGQTFLAVHPCSTFPKVLQPEKSRVANFGIHLPEKY